MILCGIVLYNPLQERLYNNISSIIKQVDKVVLVDNGSKNIKQIKKYIEDKFKNVIFILNKNNMGIAFALNQILNYSVENNYDWFLTLDQDSVVSNNLLKLYKKYIKIKNVGLICCKYFDDNIHIDKENNLIEYTFTQRCITSGSLCNTLAFNSIDGFDNRMFIDYVDFDVCSTLIEHGYKILQVNYYGINHKVGESREISFLGKRVVLYNHSPIRCYYYVRNGLYYIQKHKKNINVFKEKMSIIRRIILILAFEKNKFSKLKGIINGIKDSKKMIVELRNEKNDR